MGFSWSTFFAQIINLFILVWLMKKFLYHPIINVITKRQAYIENKVKKADEAVSNAKKQEKKLVEQAKKWDKEKQKRLDSLSDEIANLKKEQENFVYEEINSLRQKMQNDLNRETSSLQLEIRDLMIKNFLELSQKAITDLSELAPMEQAFRLFQRKFDSLKKEGISSIKKSIKKQEIIKIYSSSSLRKKEQEDLIAFIGQKLKLNSEIKFHFEVNPDLILGLEMIVGEIVLEWNLKTYLDNFEGNLNTALSNLIVAD